MSMSEAGRAGTKPAADGGKGGAAAISGSGGMRSAPAAGSGGVSGAVMTPVYRVALRVHTAKSKLTQSDLMPVFAEMNEIWLSQGGICFEIEVTASEDNRTDGLDFRYTSGTIPGASSANGLTENAHSIWSIDHPRLNDAPHPVMNPAARTTAHELGHALGLAHENPPPSTDCASPCYCAQQGDDCDDYLLRSGTKGFFVSSPEIEIARKGAAKIGLSDHGPAQCAPPTFMP